MRRTPLYPAIAVIATLLVACGGTTPVAAPSATSSVAASAAATPKPAVVKLAVSFSNVISDELPLWIAKEGGYFERNALDVELSNIASTQGVAALLSGQVKFAQMGGSETLSAAAQGADVKVIGMIAGVYPFVLEVNVSIKTVADLKGKRIGVSAVGSSSDIATRVALKKMGLDPDKDVTITAVGSVQQRTAAMLTGAIDAGLAQPPDTIALEEKGYHVLYDLAGQKLLSANTAVVVQGSYLAQNKDVVQRYVDSLTQGIVRERNDKAFSLTVLQKYLKVDDQKALSTAYDFYSKSVVPLTPEVRADHFADSVTTLGATNDKVKTFDLTKLIDNSFVQDAVKRGLDKTDK
jgi:NitT/TauT family transport system substrate-binding protein